MIPTPRLPSPDTERGRDQLQALAGSRNVPAATRTAARERLAEWTRTRQTPAPIAPTEETR